MPMTIQLDEELALQLRTMASARRLPAEELARKLLGDALQDLDDHEQWGVLNRRRLTLIDKKCFSLPLSPEEEAELEALQNELDRRLEPLDKKLLDQLRNPRRSIRMELPTVSSS